VLLFCVHWLSRLLCSCVVCVFCVFVAGGGVFVCLCVCVLCANACDLTCIVVLLLVPALSVCGDGVIELPSEQCDDNNALPFGSVVQWRQPHTCSQPAVADGCSATCEIEFAFVCQGAPSICTVPQNKGVLFLRVVAVFILGLTLSDVLCVCQLCCLLMARLPSISVWPTMHNSCSAGGELARCDMYCLL